MNSLLPFTIFLLLGSAIHGQGATLAHRWSFTGNTTDSVGGNTGILQGGASVNSDRLVLPGNGTGTNGNRMSFSSPVDLGGNFGSTGVTIETWYTDSGTGTWGKLFQFGNNAQGQELGFTHSRGNGEQSGVDRDGSQLLGEQISQNEEHHLVITISPDGNLNTWVDGDRKLSNTNTNDLSNVNTTFEAIGATSWNDPGMTGSVNEFRVWSGQLTASEVAANRTSGPDALADNGPAINSFTAAPAALEEGETITFSWSIDDENVEGALIVEIRDPEGTVVHTATSATGSALLPAGDSGGSITNLIYTLTARGSGAPASASQSATVEVAPGIPTASDQQVATLEGVPVQIVLAGDDSNNHPNASLDYAVLTQPAEGTLTGSAPNLTYAPPAGFVGVTTFTFRVNDGKYDSEAATVTITVDQAPSAPTGIELTTQDIRTDLTTGGFLAALSSDDPNVNDSHSYALVEGAGDNDNGLFTIVGSQLRVATNFAGPVGRVFSIRVRTTDEDGLSFVRIFSLTTIAPPNDIVINEIHANPPENHIRQEFIELYNPSEDDQDLSGWRLSKAVDFVFPDGTIIPSKGYLLIAEDPATMLATLGVNALGPFSGNLNSSGEELRLRNAADEIIDEVDYKVGFPWPVASDGGGASIELINPNLDNSLGSSWRASLPQSALTEATLLPFENSSWSWRPGTTEASTPNSAWRAPGFSEDGSWTQSARLPIGYGTVNGVTLNTTIPGMRFNYNSVFLRNEFTVAEGELPSQLKLNFTADDGIVVWINGTEVARRRFDPNEVPTIDDLATGNGDEGVFEELLIPNATPFLNEGSNTIAVHLFNVTTDSSDLGFDLSVIRPSSEDSPALPSPGLRNIVFSENAAPNIRKVIHTPEAPRAGEPVQITARVSDPDGVASVTLEYRVVTPGNYIPARLPLAISGGNIDVTQDRPINPDYESGWTSVAMIDDGTNGDALAGDDFYSVTLPPAGHRDLVRYRITITDTRGKLARVPYPDDLTLNFAYFVYDGVPAYEGIDAATMAGSLPVYHLLTRNEDYDEATAYNSADQINQGTEARFLYNWNASFVYEGKVYDNVRYRLRGANGRYQGRGKRSMRVRFNDGDFLEARKQDGSKYDEPWRTLTLGKGNSNRNTMTFGLNEAVNFHLFQNFGVPAANPLFVQWRVIDDPAEAPDQWRGDYHGTYFVSETYDVRFLEEHDLEKGNLYKLINQTSDWKKQQRYQGKFAPFDGSDHDTIEGNLDGSDSASYVEAHVDLESYYRYHAMVEALRHYDYWPSANKNMVYYFTTEYLPENNFKGRLQIIPWDTDSTWGPTYNSGHDVVYNALFDAAGPGSDNGTNPTLWPGYYNTVRELRDLLWQEEEINSVIDGYAAIISPLVPADFARWKGAPTDAGNYNHLGGPGINSLAAYVADMKNFAFTGGSWPGGNDSVMPQANDNGLSGTQGRDAWLDFHQGENGESSLIPNTPVITYTGANNFPTNAISFQTSAFSDPQGSGTFGAMEWRLAVAAEPRALEITPAWESGELTSFSTSIDIPTTAVRSGTSYRARVRHQDDSGRWSHWSAPIEFTTSLPNLSPYLAGLVITEVMYHPTDPTPAEVAAGFDDDDFFEYLELKNVGSTVLDLTDVRFTKGVDFDFRGSAYTTLAPGEIVLVVRSIAAFEMRYGGGLPIAGEFDPNDKLSNSSDLVKLSFGAGDTIRAFTYLDDAPWPTAADGTGRSLTLIDPAAVPDHALAASWRASFSTAGTPGQDESSDPFGDWLADQGETDPNASFNGSSLSNLLAFGLGADLLASGSPEAALPFLTIVTDGGLDYPALTYRFRQGPNSLQYVVETSDDLSTWQSGSAQTTQFGNAVDNVDGTVSVTIRSTSPLGSRQFMRLRLLLP